MKLTYRPEIDGLRAIAVVAIIFYHAQITFFGHQPFKGGFIGVDIFFVISGYLITSIILKELITTGTFSFKHFYERRVRRILPALLFVMLVSLPFAWMYLLPSSFVDFSKSILYSLGFSSNFYFHYSGQQYGAESGLLKPFLHTWSLSIEEQYYILFPIVLLITFKYFRKYLVHILILGFLISLVLAEWTSRNYASASFYFLHTRMWELLTGSILAYFEITLGHRSKNKTLNLILPSIGLFLIGHSILFFNDEMFHPSFYTLSPIIGVCLIMWFSSKNELIRKILSTKLFVGIGLISYSLYLWHYPIFAFARVNYGTPSEYVKFILIILTLLLSIITYFFIERTFRNKKNKFKSILFIIISIICFLISFSTFNIYVSGEINKKNILIENGIKSPLYKSDCKFSSEKENFLDENFFKKDFLNCKTKFNKFILILGDSHSQDLFNSISKLSKKDEFIIGLNRGGCRPLDNSTDCHFDNALKFIQSYRQNIKYIFFNHKGSYFLTNVGTKKQSMDSNFRKLPLNSKQINSTIYYLSLIKKINENLIFFGPHLEPNVDLDRNLIKKYFNGEFNFKNNSNYDLIKVDKELKKITFKNDILYISKIDILDFNFEKDFIVDNKFTFSDTDHWSEFGEVYFGKKLVFNSIIKDILFP